MKSRPRRCRHEDEIGLQGSYGREIDDNIKEEESEKEIRNKESSFYVTSILLLFYLHVKNCLGSEKVTAHYIEQAK